MNEAYGIAVLPIIVGLVKLVDMLGVPKKVLPVMALVFGVIIGIFYLAPDNYLKGILMGINLGLASVGLNSGYKNIKEALTK